MGSAMKSSQVSKEVTLGCAAPPPPRPLLLLSGPLAVSALLSLQGPVLQGLLLGAQLDGVRERLDGWSLVQCPESELGVAVEGRRFGGRPRRGVGLGGVTSR